MPAARPSDAEGLLALLLGVSERLAGNVAVLFDLDLLSLDFPRDLTRLDFTAGLELSIGGGAARCSAANCSAVANWQRSTSKS